MPQDTDLLLNNPQNVKDLLGLYVTLLADMQNADEYTADLDRRIVEAEHILTTMRESLPGFSQHLQFLLLRRRCVLLGPKMPQSCYQSKPLFDSARYNRAEREMKKVQQVDSRLYRLDIEKLQQKGVLTDEAASIYMTNI